MNITKNANKIMIAILIIAIIIAIILQCFIYKIYPSYLTDDYKEQTIAFFVIIVLTIALFFCIVFIRKDLSKDNFLYHPFFWLIFHTLTYMLIGIMAPLYWPWAICYGTLIEIIECTLGGQHGTFKFLKCNGLSDVFVNTVTLAIGASIGVLYRKDKYNK